MPVIYDGKKIIPAPFVTITKSYNKTGDGRNIGSVFNLVVRGTLVSWKGSPYDSGTNDRDFWNLSGYPDDDAVPYANVDNRLSSIFHKQEALRELFSRQGGVLEFQGPDGSAPIKCNPRVVDINFEEGRWVDVCEYTITLEADKIYISGLGTNVEDQFNATSAIDGSTSEYFISEANEDWQISFSELGEGIGGSGRFYVVKHVVSARGKRSFTDAGLTPGVNDDAPLANNKEPWENAKIYALSRITNSNTIPISTLSLASSTGYDYLIEESINILDGTYTVTESWVVGGNAIHVGTIREDYNLESGRTTVTCEGNIKGLGTAGRSISAANTAYAALNFATLASAATSATLNSTPLSTSVGRNTAEGILTYARIFDTRPSVTVTGALTDSISVSEVAQTDVIAEIPIIGKAEGPILQDMNTKTVRQRQLTIEARMPVTTSSTYNDKPDTSSIKTTYTPSATKVYLNQDIETYDYKTGTYSRNVAWTYQ